MTEVARPKRKAIPDRIKLIAVLRELGLTIEEVQFDHSPALGLRPVNEAGTDYDPPQLDPAHIYVLRTADHLRKTTGRKGASDLSRDGNGDTTRAAKAARLSEDHVAFRQTILAVKQPGQPRAKSPRWPTRKFPSRKRSLA